MCWQLKSVDVICIDSEIMRYNGNPDFHCWYCEGYIWITIIQNIPNWLVQRGLSSNLMFNRASLVTQIVKNLPTMGETQIWSGGQEDSLRREWQPTPVFLLREFHGWRSLPGSTPWGCRVSYISEQLTHLHFYLMFNKLKLWFLDSIAR